MDDTQLIQDGNTFMLMSPAAATGSPYSNPGTSAATRTLPIPTGIRIEAVLACYGQSNGVAADYPNGIYLSDLSLTDVAAGAAAYTVFAYVNVAGGHGFQQDGLCLSGL